MSRIGDTIAVARFNHRHEAEIAHGFLEDAGITAIVRADDGGGAFGAPLTFNLGSFAEVFVASEDVDQARQILSDAGFEIVPPEDSVEDSSLDD